MQRPLLAIDAGLLPFRGQTPILAKFWMPLLSATLVFNGSGEYFISECRLLFVASHTLRMYRPYRGDDGLFDEGDEDCLFLNVFVHEPTSESSAPLPVAIFVHGD